MDPMQLFQLQQMMQQQRGGMFGQSPAQPMGGQLPSYGQPTAPNTGPGTPQDPMHAGSGHGMMHGIMPYLGMGLLGGSLLGGGGMGTLGALGGFGLAGGLYSLLHGKH